MKIKIHDGTKQTCGCILAGLTLLILSLPVHAEELESAMARGGVLYDKWYKVVDVDAPGTPHGLYPGDKKYAKDAKNNWRCKECHGWDYRGKDGAYSEGKHHSGVVGINGASGKDVKEIAALLSAPPHSYGDKLSAADLNDLALFVSQGQVDMDRYIDRASKAPKGDPAKGAAYFNTICAKCHGKDGLQPKEMPPLGSLMGNPWEVMHKILNGQPAESMPSLRALDHQVAADILAYITTLPKER